MSEKNAFSGVAETFSAREKICSSVEETFSECARTFSGREKNLSKDDKGLLSDDKGLLSVNKSFLLDDKGLLLGNKSFLLDDKGFLLSNKSFLLDDKGLLLSNKSLLSDDKTLWSRLTGLFAFFRHLVLQTYRSYGTANRSLKGPAFLLVALVVFISSCTQLRKPVADAYFAETPPPRAQEFRWSNGHLPKSIDPATAAAPPETDLVRAVYEGLTDLDPKTLEAVPGVAQSWESSDDHKTWTFNLRKDAKWTNGSAVTAQDFVFAWRRLASMGETAAHSGLLNNITGYYPRESRSPEGETPDDFLLDSLDRETTPVPVDPNANQSEPTPTPSVTLEGETDEGVSPDVVEVPAPSGLGVTAIAADKLKIALKFSDKDFPKLVANPIFRPVYDDGRANPAKLDQTVITNGAFKIASADKSQIRLVRSETFWAREKVQLESIRFIRFETPEKALDAYRAGEIDAVSNADFSPAALKLLEPYEDFRRATHSALNLYQINIRNEPFDDRRVREALAISIERERLTEGQLEGSTRPAFRFTPFVGESIAALSQDAERAKNLLSDAGFPEGQGFPVIRLLINRNDAQQRIARAVAKMWKQNLNLETEIIVKPVEDFEAAMDAGEYDVIRRGVVLPTSDEMANVLTIFGLPEEQKAAKETQPTPSPSPVAETEDDEKRTDEIVVTENTALLDFRAIPLYFPTSYSLVKPYVVGFDVNSLDAPSLRAVSVDRNWQPKGQ